MKLFIINIVYIFLLCLKLMLCAPAQDLITKLPGLPHLPNFKQYSGYLTASETKHFFYW